MIRILALLVIYALPAIAILLYRQTDNFKRRQEPEIVVPPEKYVQYETANIIDAHWHDEKRIDRCEKCGMDDAPIVIGHTNRKRKKCKWCAELDSINFHLAHHGVRRLGGS